MLSSHLPAGQVQHLSVCSILHSFICSFTPRLRLFGRRGLTWAYPEGARIRALRMGGVACAWGDRGGQGRLPGRGGPLARPS